jgi:hypothetical protein
LQGDNVDKATSLLGGAVKILAQINKISQNIVCTMLQIMQTTSVPNFNNTFELMEASRFVHDCEPTLHVGVTGQFNVNTIFSIESLEEIYYLDCVDDVNYTIKGITSPGGKVTTSSGSTAVTSRNNGITVSIRDVVNLKLCVYYLKHMERVQRKPAVNTINLALVYSYRYHQ